MDHDKAAANRVAIACAVVAAVLLFVAVIGIYAPETWTMESFLAWWRRPMCEVTFGEAYIVGFLLLIWARK